jgi:hypothetical protein
LTDKKLPGISSGGSGNAPHPGRLQAVDELNNNYGEMTGDKEVTEMKIRNREFLLSPHQPCNCSYSGTAVGR